jgi:hypothetical protein
MSAITAKTVKVRETLSRPNTSTTTPNLTAFSISWDEGISAPTGFEGKKPVSAFARSGTVIDIQNGSGVAVVMLRTNTGGASNMTAKITVDGTILVNSPLTLQASQAVVYGGFSAMFGAGGTDPIMSNGWGQVESGGLQAIPWIGFSKSLKVELTNSVNYGGNGCFVGVLI